MDENLQQQLIRELVMESTEALDQFDRDLLAIENHQSDGETLHRIFRAIHSLKGSSGCLGLRKVEKLAHAGENLLSLVRDGRLLPDAALTAKLFRFCDALRRMMEQLDAAGTAGDTGFADPAELIADLNALHLAVANGGGGLAPGSSGLFSDDPPIELAGMNGFGGGHKPSAQPDAPAQPAKPVEHLPPEPSAAPPLRPAAETAHGSSETAIRVDIAQLDILMDLVGELVLARNQIMQYAVNSRELTLVNSTQRLNLITTKLQENVMKTRMQPIGNVWSKFPRIVRDISLELGKRVSLVMEGAETELDRSVLEAIKDPLTHVVRNSIDHGLETPDGRRAAHKPEEGQLRLRAFHEGGQVIIEVSDDGAGIDRERVLRKAVQRGLVSAGQAERLSESELFQFLFTPGFSTAEQVTSLSGRGVGMDVVKKNIEKIGGTADVLSERGRSTTIRIKIPLTLAIIPALVTACGGNRYAIPQASLVELVRIDEEQAGRAIEHVDKCPVYRLRGNLLPLVYLRQQLHLPAAVQAEGADGSIFLLVLQAEGRQFGLVVDGILDTEEIVVKPLGRELKGVTVYAGATIMGDGRVALILDVNGIARRARLFEESGSAAKVAARAAADRTAAAEKSRNVQELLLIGTGRERQAAIPLSSVARLEEFSPEAIEIAGGSHVVQYRGDIMPLIDVGGALDPGRAPGEMFAPADGENIRVVVYALDGRRYGLVVDRILDVMQCDAKLQRCANRPGILGSAVVQKRVTDFLDVPALVAGSNVAAFEDLRV